MDVNGDSSINTTHLNTHTVVAKADDYYLRFPIQNIDDIPDYNEEVGLSIMAIIIGFDLDEDRIKEINISPMSSTPL
ncbi:unnamed protein product [Lactuca virosa]|uniref:Uncharacterized protein n=1 Tax=Lactuca virosa TaxID=75947 RepID=A0AAU9PV62_9ASTR|nr:unnamed protein product [Lactuca virosa]